MQAILWLQETPLGVAMRESDKAFFSVLTIHVIAMGALAGCGGVFFLRVLGLMREAPITRLAQLFPVMAWAFWISLVSGGLLVAGYPAKALTNPLFYVKIACIAAALMLTRALARGLFSEPRYSQGPTPGWARGVAILGLVSWIGAIFGGRFLAYTYSTLLVYPS